MAAARKVWATICWQPDYFKQGNYAKAYQRMESAAETGNARATHALGTMLDNGQGCTTDYKRALYWFEKAAKKNHPRCAVLLRLGLPRGYGLCGGL